MRQNVADFPALCSELANWGIAEITFNQLGGRDRPEFYPAHRLRPGDVDALEARLPAIRRRLSDFGAVVIGGDNYLKRIRASARDERNPVEDCKPGESFLFIDEAGRISPCSFTPLEYGLDVRTIRTAADLAALPARYRELRQTQRSTHCDDCLSTQVCDKFKRMREDILPAPAL
jgi:radical SAM protein with 4Fe4S-binding SPASM domain